MLRLLIDLSEAVYNVAAESRVEAIVSAKETFKTEPYNFNKKVVRVNAKEVISNE